jgi:hypothetical protein
MALIVTTWMWGRKYPSYYLSRLERGVRKHLRTWHRFTVIQPPRGDELLWPGCLCRLRIFSPAFQRAHAIKEGDIILNLDLDLIVTGTLDGLLDVDGDFAILQGANAANPCPYNGSVIMLRAGAHADVWTDFSLEAVAKIPKYEFADDQGWIWHKIPKPPPGWRVGPSSGIYAFRKPQWPRDNVLPADARMVCFPGKRDPSQFLELPWIREHWR